MAEMASQHDLVTAGANYYKSKPLIYFVILIRRLHYPLRCGQLLVWVAETFSVNVFVVLRHASGILGSSHNRLLFDWRASPSAHLRQHSIVPWRVQYRACYNRQTYLRRTVPASLPCPLLSLRGA